MSLGLRGSSGVAAPPYTKGPYTWDQKINFTAGASGILGPNQYKATDVWFVDKTNVSTAGDGKSWENAFLTITAALAVAGNWDTIYVGPGFYTEAAELTITQTGLKIIGCNSSGKTRGPCAMKTPTVAGAMLTIAVNSNDVEICNIGFIATSGQKAIQLGGAAAGYVWRTHIHDCSFFGDDTGTYAIAVYGATTTPSAGAFPDCAECVVERCHFYAWATACTCTYGTRVLTKGNTMFVPAAGVGIVLGAGRPFSEISGNIICGINNTDTGILITGDSDGATVITGNTVVVCATLITKNVSDAGTALNPGYKDGDTAGQVDCT